MKGNIVVPDEFPVINLSSTVMTLPGTMSHVLLRGAPYEELLADTRAGKCPFALAVMSKPGIDRTPDKFHTLGVVAELEADPDQPAVLLAGMYRGEVAKWRRNRNDKSSYWLARVTPVEDLHEVYFKEVNGAYIVSPEYMDTLQGVLLKTKQFIARLTEEFHSSNDFSAKELQDILDNFENYDFSQRNALDHFIWNVLAAIPEVTPAEKQAILSSRILTERIGGLAGLVFQNLKILVKANKFEEVIEKRSQEEEEKEDKSTGKKSGRTVNIMTKVDKADEFIKGAPSEVIDRYNRFLELRESMNEDAQKAVLSNLKRLKSLGKVKDHSSEWGIVINHTDRILDLPWNSRTPPENNINQVEDILEKEHHGLQRIKKKISKNLAARILNPKAKNPILCFVGPPGTGKTSISQSIAKALGRKLVRISLGAVRDEAEIRGHRSTYINALPGRIIEGLYRAGVKNPVFVLDELDKIGADLKGDPSSALLEVLDPEQNHSFTDHYLGVPFDLSEVLFIGTANLQSGIQKALLDRMNIISLPGYTEQEKIQIANNFLVPKGIMQVGLSQHNVTVSWPDNDPSSIISKVIVGHTRESGVRELERKILEILEDIASQYLKSGQKQNSFVITEELLHKSLGKPEYLHERINVTEPGEAVGLVVTGSGGGDIIYVQAKLYPRVGDEKGVSQTGKLGEALRESNKNALTVVKRMLRSRQDIIGKLKTDALHLSIPDTATPKDGPSAGITMATAIYSELVGKPVRPYIVMTGGLTITGRVHAVGGIREKVLAGHRDGAKEVILPDSNKNDNDIEEIPKEIKDELKIHFVKDFKEVIAIVLPEEVPAS